MSFCQILADLSNSFTGTLCSRFAITWWPKIRVHRVLEKSLKVLEFWKKIPGPWNSLKTEYVPWKSLKSPWIWMFQQYLNIVHTMHNKTWQKCVVKRHYISAWPPLGFRPWILLVPQTPWLWYLKTAVLGPWKSLKNHWIFFISVCYEPWKTAATSDIEQKATAVAKMSVNM